jgi:hypothetical protein
MVYETGTFDDTVWPRCKTLFARFEAMKFLMETLDFTAAAPGDQAEAHAFLDRLEAWMDELEAWDRAAMERERIESLRLFWGDVRNG